MQRLAYPWRKARRSSSLESSWEGQGIAQESPQARRESTVLPDKFMCLFSPVVTQSLRVPVFFHPSFLPLA